MSEVKQIGPHKLTEIVGKDINGRFMVKCQRCITYAHAFEISEAEAELTLAPCVSDCENCNSLRRSYDQKPAVPLGGTVNTILYTCPKDGRRWWQSNTFFHLWQQVTSEFQWQALCRDRQPKGRV